MNSECMNMFTEHHDLLGRKLGGKFFFLCHYAMRTWPGPWGRTFHCYGHSHGRMIETENSASCDVGVDVWDYTPVSLDMISNKMKEKKNASHYKKGELDLRVESVRQENREIRKITNEEEATSVNRTV